MLKSPEIKTLFKKKKKIISNMFFFLNEACQALLSK